MARHGGYPDLFTESDSACLEMSGEVVTDGPTNTLNITRCQLTLCQLKPPGKVKEITTECFEASMLVINHK